MPTYIKCSPPAQKDWCVRCTRKCQVTPGSILCGRSIFLSSFSNDIYTQSQRSPLHPTVQRRKTPKKPFIFAFESEINGEGSERETDDACTRLRPTYCSMGTT